MPKIHPQKIEIRGKPWTILTRRMKYFDGLCDHPGTPSREIWIHTSLKGEEMLSTLIHEATHASFSDLSEEAVSEFGNDLARILWHLGYKNEDWDL